MVGCPEWKIHFGIKRDDLAQKMGLECMGDDLQTDEFGPKETRRIKT